MAKRTNSTLLLFEELEPRLLFSADIAEALAADAIIEEYVEEPVIIAELDTEPSIPDVAVDQPDETEELSPTTEQLTGEQTVQTTNTVQQEVEIVVVTTNDSNGNDDLPTTTHAEEVPSKELVFINSNVNEQAQLIAEIDQTDDLSRTIEIVILDSEQEGITQVTSVLEERSDLDTVHFITHGRDGLLSLGNDWLDKTDLLENSAAINDWGEAISDDGDILLYGCSISADKSGEQFVDLLAELTGADVSASDDRTGHISLGGDWDLEYKTGSIEAEQLIDEEGEKRWNNLLSGTVADDFSDNNFSGNSGTIAWTNDWQEIGESDGYDYGNVLVYPHIYYGSQPLMSLWKTPDIGVWREADLSGGSSGVLSFDYAFYMTESDDTVTVDISTDGGTSWYAIDSLSYNGTHSTLQTIRYDISSYLDSDTRIRFRTMNFGENDDFLLDNVHIELDPNVLTVNNTNDTVDGNTSSIAALIASPGADGISLREAIIATNNTSGSDTINFDVDGSGPHTIFIGGGGLPLITDTVLIDGASEPDYTGIPIIELEGSGAGPLANGLTIGDGFSGGSGSTVRGLVINNFDGSGIYVLNAEDVTIQGNFFRHRCVRHIRSRQYWKRDHCCSR